MVYIANFILPAVYIWARELLCVPDVPGSCCYVVVYKSKQSNLSETKVAVPSLPSLLTAISEHYFQTNKIKQPVKLPYNFLSYLGVCLGNLWCWWQWITLTASFATEETELSLHEWELCNTTMSGVYIDMTEENYLSQISSFKVQL